MPSWAVKGILTYSGLERQTSLAGVGSREESVSPGASGQVVVETWKQTLEEVHSRVRLPHEKVLLAFWTVAGPHCLGDPQRKGILDQLLWQPSLGEEMPSFLFSFLPPSCQRLSRMHQQGVARVGKHIVLLKGERFVSPCASHSPGRDQFLHCAGPPVRPQDHI